MIRYHIASRAADTNLSRRSFLAEAAFFLALVAILALTFVSGALVIIHFLQLPQA